MDTLNFDNFIHIETGMYCLNDIAEKLICSKNVKEYIKKINNKKWIKGNYYISKEDMISILLKCKTDIGKQYLEYINDQNKPKEDNIKIAEDNTKHMTTKEELQSKADNRKFIDHGTNEIIYNNNKIIFFEYNEILYLRANDVCNLLGYTNYSDAINTHIDKEDLFLFNDVGKRESQIPIPNDDLPEYLNQIPKTTNKDDKKIKNIRLEVG